MKKSIICDGVIYGGNQRVGQGTLSFSLVVLKYHASFRALNAAFLALLQNASFVDRLGSTRTASKGEVKRNGIFWDVFGNGRQC